jgi:hypothetical protein
MPTPISVLVVNDTRVDLHHGCNAVMGAITSLLRSHCMEPVLFWPAHAEWRGNAQFEETISKVDLVLINGEGTIHHDRPAGRRLLDLGAWASTEGVPVALINVGWETNGPEFVASLSDFDLIAARDSRSAERMRVGGANVRVVPDLSLWFARVQGIRPYSNGGRAGIGVTDNVDRLKALTLERLRLACGGQTVSIVHGTRGVEGWVRFLRGGVALSEDFRYPARFAALLQLSHRLWWQSSLDTQGFLTQLSSLKLLVSGRFHACTLALAAGTPLIAQPSNTDKIEALFHDAGLDSWRCGGSLDAASIYDARAIGWSEHEYRCLCAYLDEAENEVKRLFSDLANLVMD